MSELTGKAHIRRSLELARTKGWIPSIFSIDEVKEGYGDFILKFAMLPTEPVLKLLREHTPLTVLGTDKLEVLVEVPVEWVSAPTVDMFPDLEPTPAVAAPPPAQTASIDADKADRALLLQAYDLAVQSVQVGVTIPFVPESVDDVKRLLIRNLMVESGNGGYHITPAGCIVIEKEYPRINLAEREPITLKTIEVTETMTFQRNVFGGSDISAKAHKELDSLVQQGWERVHIQYVPLGAELLLAVMLERVKKMPAPRPELAAAEAMVIN